MRGYLRGQIAKLADVNAETLRYYENHGLIPPPARTESGYRIYSEEVLTRIAFIKNAKSCGFTLKEIRKALARTGDRRISVADFIAAIDKKIGSIDKEIAKKEAAKAKLAGLKSNLLAQDKHSGVQEIVRILNLKS